MPPRSSPRFMLRARLGMGGMGDVYLAEMSGSGPRRLVALKRIRADRRTDPGLVAGFQREARISSLLRHPNIVRVEAWGEDKNGWFLAMEYVDGRSASELSRRVHEAGESLSTEAGWSVLCDVAEALAHAHGFDGEQGAVVHRDVTADNVLISYEGEAKLADFGIAKATGTTNHTGTGILKGKSVYLAPELIRGVSASPQSDVYSVGILAHRLFTGVVPFRGETEAAVLQAVLFAAPPSIGALRPDLPPGLVKVIDACLSKDPADRPEGGQQLMHLLAADAEKVEHRTALARAMERFFPRDGDDFRTEISRAIAVNQTNTVSGVVRPLRRRASSTLTVGAIASVCAAAAVAGAFAWRTAAQPEPETGPAPSAAQVQDAAASEVAALASLHTGDTPPEPPVASAATEPVMAPAKAERAPAPPQRTSRPQRTSKRSSSRGEPTKAGAQAKAAPAQDAQLQILVYPWAQVFIDGVLVGVAPPLPIQKVTPGPHSIILANPELNVRRQFQIVAKRGEVTPLKVVLTE